MRDKRFPYYQDDANYTTNAPSYYEDLARKEKLIRLLAERIWGYEKILDETLEQIQERFHAWDKNLEDFPEDVKVLLQKWLDDGTLDHIINETIFNWKLDTSIFEQFRDSTTAQLQQITRQIRESGAMLDGVTDDTNALRTLLNTMTGGNLLLSNCTMRINGDISIPENVNIIGVNATILFGGRFILSGSNEVSGLTFDGEQSSNYIPFKVEGKNCNIHHNVFKNFKTSTTEMETNVIFVYADHVSVNHNIFDTIIPDEITNIARAIRSTDADDLTITHNTFKNMRGVVDSDYIFIQSSAFDAVYFPFNEAPAPVTSKRYLTKRTLIEHNTFEQSCKSSVKIQCSGVTVKNNDIFVNSSVESEIHSCIRCYNTSNTTITNNNIDVSAKDINKIFEIMYSTQGNISNNRVLFTSDLTNSAYTYYKNYTITMEYCEGVNVNFNDVLMRNMTGFIYALSTKRSHITNNNVVLNQSTRTQCNNFYLTGTSTIKSELNNIENNIITGNTDKQTLRVINNLNTFFKNNVLMGAVVIQDSSILKFYTNEIGNNGELSYLIELHLTNNDIQFIGNEFNTNTATYPVRFYNVTTKFKLLNNNIYTSYSLEFFNVATGQNMLEIAYATGSTKLSRLDHGTTGVRPTAKLNVGHSYFDTTLNKPIFWTGSQWVDFSGVNV